MASAAKSTAKPTPEVVADTATVDAKVTADAGTKPGEQIASTEAEGVAVPDVPGGAVPEATPDNLPEQPAAGPTVDETPAQPSAGAGPGSGDSGDEPAALDTVDTVGQPTPEAGTNAPENTGPQDANGQPDPDVNQPDVAVEQMRLNPQFRSAKLEAPGFEPKFPNR